MKISLCVITKNEEKNIATCINSVKNIVDEIVVVDTGSIDDIVKIVRKLGGYIYYFKWIDDFAAARNFALSKVTGDWIIFLDADEYISKESAVLLKSIIQKAHKLKLDSIETELININQVTRTFQNSMPMTRIFKRSPLIGYKGRIHETPYKVKGVLTSLDATQDIKIFHTGYSTDTIQEKKKSERNRGLLYKELESNPNKSNIHFYLAESWKLDQNIEKVLHHTREVFRCENGSLNGIYQKAFFHQLDCMIILKYAEDDIIDIYNKALQFDETYPDYEILMGNYYAQRGEYRKAISYFYQAIEKMGTYKGTYEVWANVNIKEVFKVIANLHYILQEYNECVKYLIYVLNVYKEDEESLIRLLEVLKAKNSLEEVFSVINKIYDMTVEKDQLIVLRACVALKDVELNMFIKDILKNQAKKNRHTYY